MKQYISRDCRIMQFWVVSKLPAMQMSLPFNYQVIVLQHRYKKDYTDLHICIGEDRGKGISQVQETPLTFASRDHFSHRMR